MMRKLRDWINAGLELRMLKLCEFRGLAYLQQRNVRMFTHPDGQT